MVNGQTIQVRLTKQQKERAILGMQNAGFKTMSSFIRNLIVGKGLEELRMIQEIHKKLVGEVKNGKNKTGV